MQLRNLDLQITTVYLDNRPPFVEVFLFDGPDLQGRLTRFARVTTPDSPLPTMLDEPGLKNQVRSLLGGEFSVPGRRFSASTELTQAAEQFFASHLGGTSFGTETLTQAPRFSWDGYASWLAHPNDPKTAALRIQWDFRIDDIDYGSTAASATINCLFRRTGGMQPVKGFRGNGTANIPQPWKGANGGIGTPGYRWNSIMIELLTTVFRDKLANLLSALAGSAPGSMLILPGRSTAIPHTPQVPGGAGWGLIEIGRTDDDATIVFFP